MPPCAPVHGPLRADARRGVPACTGTGVGTQGTIWSNQIGHRLNTMQGASSDELKIIFKLPGHKWEKVLHDRLKEHRMHGEWFDLNDDARAIVAEVLTEAGVAH